MMRIACQPRQCIWLNAGYRKSLRFCEIQNLFDAIVLTVLCNPNTIDAIRMIADRFFCGMKTVYFIYHKDTKFSLLN
jgi:hypothetical protein